MNSSVEKKNSISKSVSIIIPSYNRRVLLQKNLKAVDSQNFSGYLEVIVVDDGSKDGTIQMLSNRAAASDGPAFRYFETPRLGPANARNLGVAHAKGDILIFLDDDSVIQNESYVQQMVASFKEDNVGIVAGRTIDYYSHILGLVRAGDPPEIDFDNPSKLSKTIGVPTKNAAFLKEAIRNVGGFNPIFKYSYGEDIDLCVRILKHGYRLAFNKEALVYHYPNYTFSQYIKKSYSNGFSIGIYRSLHPDKNSKYYLLKKIIFPLLAVRQFIRKAKFCSDQNLFTKSAFKEMALMFAWISVSYAALSWGETVYQIKMIIPPIRFKV